MQYAMILPLTLTGELELRKMLLLMHNVNSTTSIAVLNLHQMVTSLGVVNVV